MLVSVRDALDLVGQSASIRQLAGQRNAPFPLSVRQFVGAPPPGQLLRKTVSPGLLQQKIDVIFNERSKPLYHVRFHGTHYGASTAAVFVNDPVHGYLHEPNASVELAGPGEVL